VGNRYDFVTLTDTAGGESEMKSLGTASNANAMFNP
jgi:hypothetical protein